MEGLVLSGAPDAPVLAKPGALSFSQTFPSIEVDISKPNDGVSLLHWSLLFDVVDSPCALLLMAYALLVSVMDVLPSNIDLNHV